MSLARNSWIDLITLSANSWSPLRQPRGRSILTGSVESKNRQPQGISPRF